MTFSPSIQALIGPHTAQTTGSIQCAVNWAAKKAWIQGTLSGTNWIARQDVLSGTEENFGSTALFTHPPSADRPIEIDAAGNLYVTWAGFNGGGLTKVDSTTLTQIAFGGSSAGNFPIGYPGLPGGTLANISVGSTQFILAGSIGGIFGILDYNAVFNEQIFAGRQQNWSGSSPGGVVCAGPIGSGLGYSIVSETGSVGTRILRVYQIYCIPGGTWTVSDWPTQNPLITSTEIFDLIPTDVDASWTEIHGLGVCLDQTDNNLIICVTSQNANNGYYIKTDVGTGAILWQVPIGNNSGSSGSQLAKSSITNSRYAFFNNSGHTVTTINTVDGSTVVQSAGLAGITGFTRQCYNDSLGAILANITFAKTTDSPTQLNSTPDSYTGWTMIYVNPPPTPPPGNRRFLAECGPIRTGASTSPIIPPTPPPPPPPPVTVTDIITLSGDTLITLSGSNIITDT